MLQLLTIYEPVNRLPVGVQGEMKNRGMVLSSPYKPTWEPVHRLTIYITLLYFTNISQYYNSYKIPKQ